MSSRNYPLIQTLQVLREHRQPFKRLGQTLIRDLLQRYVAGPDAPIIEIGAGDGQLVEWLPKEALGRTLHTEPVASAARAFLKHWPDAAIRRARAEALPVADGSAAAVIGLCVLDVVPDGELVARELARVIRPGGHFIHVLDMSTHLGSWFRELIEGGVVPFPNVFFDPSTSHWPEDVFLAPVAQLRRILDLLTFARHPLGPPLRQYLTLFETVPFPEHRALAEFAQLSASSKLRSSLRLMFRTAWEFADPSLREELAAFQGCILSSSRYFERRLRTWFTPRNGFAVVQSDVVSWAEQTRQNEAQPPVRYQSLCVGERRTLPCLPETPRCSGSPSLTLGAPNLDDVIRELGAFVFVSRRIGSEEGSAEG